MRFDVTCFENFKIIVRTIISRVLSTIVLQNLNRKEEICLNRLRVDLLLKGQLYAHNFRNIQGPKCNNCVNTNVTTKHFLIQCNDPNHTLKLADLRNALDDLNLLEYYNTLRIMEKCNFLLFGNQIDFSFDSNKRLISITAKFIDLNHKDFGST